MTKPAFDKPGADGQPVRDAKRAVHVRDAATLIIVREGRTGPQLLMGQRSAGHSFMPNKFVFPGGRLDRGDYAIAPARTLAKSVERKVIADPRGARAVQPAKANALALAALRETFEETGLRIGTASQVIPRTRSQSWASYMATGIAPNLQGLDLVARAITPPYRHKRFDARFFMVDANKLADTDPDALEGSGELLKLHWVTVPEARDLDLPNITKMIIEVIGKRLGADPGPTAAQMGNLPKVPFFYFERGISKVAGL